ncbi:receptor-like kinase in in flowers 3 [Prunus dulcis]|uniref:non-specific serine/threonine protein kinase n=1 Tax=Prunus dulcis TaxID=3755 RepID=A0A4Y1RBS4_PRUDU|nr:receptor-like kinase in in flowers 3 [Prunus dulcis]
MSGRRQHPQLQGLLNLMKELRIATENFREENKIGQGGFGSVYKGTLKNGTLAAIKVLSAESRQGSREFLTEIEVIANIEHDNLVKLYGGGHSSIQFSWSARCKICIGVARGLAFLHEEVQPHIIHRDIKASNILLDKDLSPKISDFGLAKFIAPNLTHVSTRVAGTAGYLAPEYAIRGQVTRKADVWEHHEREQLVELVDTALNGIFNVEEACRFLKIGLLCTQDMPKLRPSMSTVVEMLTGERDVNEEKISKPGLFSEFMDQTEGHRDKATARPSSYTASASGRESLTI